MQPVNIDIKKIVFTITPNDPSILQKIKEVKEEQERILACNKVDMEKLSRTYVTM